MTAVELNNIQLGSGKMSQGGGKDKRVEIIAKAFFNSSSEEYSCQINLSNDEITKIYNRLSKGELFPISLTFEFSVSNGDENLTLRGDGLYCGIDMMSEQLECRTIDFSFPVFDDYMGAMIYISLCNTDPLSDESGNGKKWILFTFG